MKVLTLLLALAFLIPQGHAATGLKEIIETYQYNVTVEWDQKNEAELEKFESEFRNNVIILIQSGHSSDAIIQEALSEIKDERVKKDLAEVMNLFKNKDISQEEAIDLLAFQAENMSHKGASWSTVTKIIVGVVITYAVLKSLMFVIYFWDTETTDCSKLGTCSTPPKPE